MTTPRLSAAIIILISLSPVGCSNVAPLTSADAHYAQDNDEQKLIRDTTRLSKELRDQGLVLTDNTVNAYLQAVLDRVIPTDVSRKVSINIHVIRDPVVNAFALPNGDIYLTVGLLALLNNEAQLAFVIGHEVAHVVERHGLQQLRERKSKIIAAHITDIALFGTSIAYVPFVASIAGYSREQEKEADLIGLTYLAAAGYPLDGADQLFALLQEVKPGESLINSIFGDHPANKLRAQYVKEFITKRHLSLNANKDPGRQRYQIIRASLIVENIQLKLNIKQYQLALDAADRALKQDPDDPWLHYYHGEALRLMAEDPEGAARESAWINGTDYNVALKKKYRKLRGELHQLAKKSYRKALDGKPGFPPAYRGLGLVEKEEGDNRAAREALTFYLRNGQDIKDRRYITRVLGELTTP